MPAHAAASSPLLSVEVLVDQRRSDEVDEQRHEQPPRQQAAGEVQRAELGPDDVADAQVRGRDGRGREAGDAAGRHLDGECRSGPASRSSACSVPMPMAKSFEERKMPNPSRKRTTAPTPIARNSCSAASAALLACLVDFAGGHRLGEGQAGIFHHDPAQDGHEHDAQDAAQDHQARGQDVLLHHVRRVELPQLQDDECGNR